MELTIGVVILVATGAELHPIAIDYSKGVFVVCALVGNARTLGIFEMKGAFLGEGAAVGSPVPKESVGSVDAVLVVVQINWNVFQQCNVNTRTTQFSSCRSMRKLGCEGIGVARLHGLTSGQHSQVDPFVEVCICVVTRHVVSAHRLSCERENSS